ncbi:MAG: PQQ-binding-like beta-propeller repeat protein [bacterium]|nr:PQQ-binding-like beta-propeller repeat protein [bacterium]
MTGLSRRLALAILLAAFTAVAGANEGEWTHYARDQHATRYSPLTRINKQNVSRLERAWVHRTGDIADEKSAHYFECTPLMIDGAVYVMTTFSRLQALDALSGELLWEFNPDPPLSQRETGAGGLASRGVAYWKDGGDERIFLPVRDGRLYSIDLKTHRPDPAFGDNGCLNLREGLPNDGDFYFLSAPPAVCGDLIVPPYGENDWNRKNPQIPLRAFNARTGELVWSFNTVPQNENEFGADTWEGDSNVDRGGGNVWAMISADVERGLLFVPVSTPNYDFYGGDRPGQNLFTDSLVALELKTGKRVWHFQAVHHDLWDYDLPAQPILLDLTMNGKTIPAVAQCGKTGFIYVLNRETGESLFPIHEKPVPASGVPGESAWPTQPFPEKPPAVSRQLFDENEVTGLDEETHEYILNKLHELRSEGIFTPPSLKGTIVLPGLHGGCNWSGGAASPDGMLYVNTTEFPYLIPMKKAPEGREFAYLNAGGAPFRDQNGYPAIKPPWGELVKLDLNRGEIVWRQPLGEFAELTARGIPPTGQENFGGPTVTASGLVFIASTPDAKIRAFDAENGAVLWRDQMEAAGFAAPITYLGSDGEQYVVICAGGGCKPGAEPLGDYVIAYRLSASKN